MILCRVNFSTAPGLGMCVRNDKNPPLQTRRANTKLKYVPENLSQVKHHGTRVRIRDGLHS